MSYTGPERRIGPADRRNGATNPIVDVLALMQCKPGFHMEGTHFLYTRLFKTAIITSKGKNGFPWDGRLYDANMIYDWFTELDWTSPRDYKVAKYPSKFPFMYRYAKDGDIVRASDSTTTIVQNCKAVRDFSLGLVQHEFWGPFTYNIGGDVGTKPCYEIHYRWSGQPDGSFRVREIFTFCFGYGQVGWITQNWNGSNYDPPAKTSVFNLLRLGDVAPVFPCLQIS